MKKNLSLKVKKQIALATLALGVICFFVGGKLTFIAAFAAPAVWWLLEQYNREQHRKAIDTALPMLDGIYAGLHYVGTNAEVIDSRTWDDRRLTNGLSGIEQLCKTKRGNWFIFRFTIRLGTSVPCNLDVIPCDEDKASRWLEKSTAVYRRVFGEPESA